MDTVLSGSGKRGNRIFLIGDFDFRSERIASSDNFPKFSRYLRKHVHASGALQVRDKLVYRLIGNLRITTLDNRF